MYEWKYSNKGKAVYSEQDFDDLISKHTVSLSEQRNKILALNSRLREDLRLPEEALKSLRELKINEADFQQNGRLYPTLVYLDNNPAIRVRRGVEMLDAAAQADGTKQCWLSSGFNSLEGFSNDHVIWQPKNPDSISSLICTGWHVVTLNLIFGLRSNCGFGWLKKDMTEGDTLAGADVVLWALATMNDLPGLFDGLDELHCLGLYLAGTEYSHGMYNEGHCLHGDKMGHVDPNPHVIVMMWAEHIRKFLFEEIRRSSFYEGCSSDSMYSVPICKSITPLAF